MASQKYFCFKCRDNSWPTEEVVFSGKDEQGKTILKNPDGSLHQHKQKQQQSAAQLPHEQQGSTTVVTEPTTSMKIINAKLDRIISLLESQQKK